MGKGRYLFTSTGSVYQVDQDSIDENSPLLPVEERAVPQEGAVEDEVLAQTQPFPVRPPPLHPLTLEPEDAWGFSFWDRGRCRELIEGAKFTGTFTPPGLRLGLQYPGMVGGINWGSLSIDPGRDLLIVNTQRIATLIRLVPRAEYDAVVAESGVPKYGMEPQAGTPYALERRPLLSPLGVPCNPPPWGTLVGIDLATGDLRWEVPLGTARDLAPWPIWVFLGTLGVPNLGGPITTASGLTFIAATTDNYLRAFDTETGEVLWRARLPAGGQATPMSYAVEFEDGTIRQFVVIAAGGHARSGTKLGDHVVAFALDAR